MDQQELERIIEEERITENSVVAAVYIRGPRDNYPRATLRIGFFHQSQEGPVIVNQANYKQTPTGAFLKKLTGGRLDLGDDIVHIRKLTDLDVNDEDFQEESQEEVHGFIARYCKVKNSRGYTGSWMNRVQIGTRKWEHDLRLSSGISSIVGNYRIRLVTTSEAKLSEDPKKAIISKTVQIISPEEADRLLREYL